MAEGGIGERRQRLLHFAELPCHEREAVLALDRAVQPCELVPDAVEPFEKRVELAVSDVVLLHKTNSTSGSGGRPGS